MAPRLFNPLGGSHDETVKAGLSFNRFELHTVKGRVMETFPKAKELDAAYLRGLPQR